MGREKDKISRKAFIVPGTKLLSALLSMDVVKVEQIAPRVRQTIVEREADIVLLIRTRDGRKYILHLEFQSSNDNKMVIRMAIYDYMLYEEQGVEVLSIVIYIGQERLTMKNKIKFAGTEYTCPIIDIRDLDPQLFIDSDQPRLMIHALLAGPDSADRQQLIRKILTKLQVSLAGSETELKECMAEMGFLVQTRGKHIQQLLKKEIAAMPVTLDIKKSIFYDDVRNASLEDGRIEGEIKGKTDDAKRMIEDGMELALVHKYTGLPMNRLRGLKTKLRTAGRLPHAITS